MNSSASKFCNVSSQRQHRRNFRKERMNFTRRLVYTVDLIEWHDKGKAYRPVICWGMMSGFFSSFSLMSPLLSSFLNGLLGCFSSVSRLLPSRNLSSRWMGIVFVCLPWSSIWDLLCSSTCVCWILSTTITITATMIKAVTTPIITLSIGISLMFCLGLSKIIIFEVQFFSFFFVCVSREKGLDSITFC